MSVKKRGLGRGLSDLGLNELLSRMNENKVTQDPQTSSLRQIDVKKIIPGKYQPRQDFDNERLQELAESILTQGIIQPIVVREKESEHYEIIAGERRWRAAKLAGLEKIPAVIRDIPDESAIAVALIENIQRENLNAIEEATALQRLSQEFSMTHQQIAKVVGRSRTTITNLLRLLSLMPAVKALVEKGQLEMGHARALLALEEKQQLSVAQYVVEKELSVRETELYIKRLQNLTDTPTMKASKDPGLIVLEKDLAKKWGVRVSIKHKDSGKGKLVIHYRNLQQLKDLV